MGRILLTDADPADLSVEDRLRQDMNRVLLQMHRDLAEEIFVRQPAEQRVMRLRDSLGVPTRWHGPTITPNFSWGPKHE